MKKARRITDLALGLMYLVVTLIGYLPAIPMGEPIHLAEWCCVTGVLGGAFFILSFFLGEKLPENLHLDVTMLLNLILLATAAMGLELEGAFWFIHLVGPVLVLIRFFIFCDCRQIKSAGFPLTCIIFPCAYIILSWGLLKMTGQCPFPARLILVGRDAWSVWVIVGVLCALLAVLNYGLFYLNRFFGSKKKVK